MFLLKTGGADGARAMPAGAPVRRRAGAPFPGAEKKNERMFYPTHSHRHCR